MVDSVGRISFDKARQVYQVSGPLHEMELEEAVSSKMFIANPKLTEFRQSPEKMKIMLKQEAQKAIPKRKSFANKIYTSKKGVTYGIYNRFE